MSVLRGWFPCVGALFVAVFYICRTLPYARVSGIHIGVSRHVGGGVLTQVTFPRGINNRLCVYGFDLAFVLYEKHRGCFGKFRMHCLISIYVLSESP